MRRGRILDAAEGLIHTAGDVSFSMRELARHAAVSPATPFNLMGSKREVLLALLERSLDEQFERLTAARKLATVERVFALDLDALSRLLHDQFRVTMLNWAMLDINAREWFAELEYATAMLLRGAVTDALRCRMHQRVRAAQEKLRHHASRGDRALGQAPSPMTSALVRLVV